MRGSSGYTSPGSYSGQILEGRQVTLPSQSFALLSGQDSRSQTRKGAGFCLLQKGFHEGYFSCYDLILDQADGYPLLRSIRSGVSNPSSGEGA